MDPVSTIASIIAIYQLASTVSGLCFRYGHGVRGADRDADLVINEIDTFQRYLRTLKEVLAKEELATNATDRLRNLEEILTGESAVLKMCAQDLNDLKTKLVKVQSEGRFKEAIHKLSWPLKQEEVRKTLNTLNKFTDAVDRALNVDNNEVIRGIDSRTKNIHSSLQNVESRQKRDNEFFQQSQEEQRANELKEKILDWLDHPDPSETHGIARRDRNDQAKTGRWFLDGSAFKEFQTSPRSVMWLHGDSGCGKSVLCSAVIDEILAARSGDSRIELAYWYFSVTDRKRASVDILLRALVAQLIIRLPIPPFLLDLWNARKMGREAPKATELMQAIQKILVAEPSRHYSVVIDALDESDETERAELMRLIRGLALLEADTHVLVTSRTNTLGVEKEMKDLPAFFSIAVEREDADIDILAHVTERLENDDDLAKWSPKVRQLIKDTLIEKAGGMFRWVDCQLQAVRKCRKPNDVRKTLDTLPGNLHEIYARDLAKVDESASQDVLRLLEWLAFPQQKIRIEEAVDMLAVDMESDSPAFDEENRIVDSEEVVKMCGCLVRLDRDALDRNYMGHAAQVQTLAAAHSSVIDFLKTQSIKIGSENVVKFSKSKANLRMAETCLIYLRYFPANSITLTQGNITSYPFARLCALMWDNFYREVLSTTEPVDMARLNDLVMELLSSPTATLNWVKLSNPENISEGVNFGVNVYQLKPAIYYAALLGLPDIVRKLIQEGTPVDSVVGPRFGTQPDLYTAEWSSPLQVATGKGNVEIAKILLDAGSHVDLKHDKGFTALYLACRNRDKKMVELLLAHGANPNIQHCGTWDHALQLACANGDEEIVGLLLENGAKIDLHGDFFDNAFQVACVEGGKLETAKILIEAGANFRMTNTIGHSALLATILNRRSQLELFDYLIDLDVDPLQGDRRGCNGLHYAARAKKCEVIKRLLEFGLDVNGTDSNGWSPLHWAVASTEDSADVVRLLLQSGCDKSMRDKQDKTARDLAMLFNRTEEATMLDGTAQAYAKASPGGACAVQFLIYICDGCSVVSKAQSVPLIKLIGYKDRRHCKPASWYRCADCINFDFCFRCILDKDVTHLKDHRFSNEPA